MPNRYCVQFASSDSALCEVFSDAIKAMIADGTMDALIAKWNLVDYSALQDV
jgi:ABC-type amino acid transport substrate-binding protein